MTRYKLTIIFCILISIWSCSWKGNPVNHYFMKDGVEWRTSKIYCWINDKKELAEVDIFKGDWLQETIVYYELWPNYEWKFVSKTGFTTRKNGVYLLNNDTLTAPNNIIYEYFDKNNKEQIEVYKGGKRVPYTLGRPDGTRSEQYLVDTPGVYIWRGGKEYFERPFTKEELENNKKSNLYLNNKTIPTDTIKK